MRRIGVLAAAMLGMFGLSGVGSQSYVNSQNRVQEVKAASFENKRERKIRINNQGGLDIPPYSLKGSSRSPKEYGELFGCKKHGKRSNRLRFSHNAKLNRR